MHGHRALQASLVACSSFIGRIEDLTFPPPAMQVAGVQVPEESGSAVQDLLEVLQQSLWMAVPKRKVRSSLPATLSLVSQTELWCV
jgi:hypothetical protein